MILGMQKHSSSKFYHYSLKQFLFPKQLHNDIVSYVYSQSFKWTFFSTLLLILGYLINSNENWLLLVSKSTYPFVKGSLLPWITGEKNVLAIYLLIATTIGLVYPAQNLQRIPEDYIGTKKKRLVSTTFSLLFVIILITLEVIHKKLLATNFSVSIMLGGLLLSYLSALWSNLIARALFDLTGALGIRPIQESMFK